MPPSKKVISKNQKQWKKKQQGKAVKTAKEHNEC